MQKRKTYPTNIIRRDYSYEVHEVAELYGLAPDTVFRWIRDEGLKRLPKIRPYLIHSSDLIDFLDRKVKKRKHPCKPQQMYCCRCRKPREVAPSSLQVRVQRNKQKKLCGECIVCGCKVNKLLKLSEWNKNHPLWLRRKAKSEKKAVKPIEPFNQHNGTNETPRECQIESNGQFTLGIG